MAIPFSPKHHGHWNAALNKQHVYPLRHCPLSRFKLQYVYDALQTCPTRSLSNGYTIGAETGPAG